MPHTFDGEDWASEIAEITNTHEYHNAVVAFLDPSLATTTWDIETNTRTTVGSPVLATGIHARINWPLRSVADPGTTDMDPTTIRSGRCAIDYAEYPGPLRNGMQMVVTDGGRNPDLLRYRFRIAEAQNASWMVSRVFKITVDGEAVLDPSLILPSGGGEIVPVDPNSILFADNHDGTSTVTA